MSEPSTHASTQTSTDQFAAAAATSNGTPLTLDQAQYYSQREAAYTAARDTDAGKQFFRCFPRWQRISAAMRQTALDALAANKPVNPNAASSWSTSIDHGTAVLRRHGLSDLNIARLTRKAEQQVIAGQDELDDAAGLDWSVLMASSDLEAKLRRAHAQLPVDLDDPSVWIDSRDARAAFARQRQLGDHQVDDISRWALANPSSFNADELRSWRIGSQSWHEIAAATLAPVTFVERPVGVFVYPDAKREGWRLAPCLSLDMIRLIGELGGSIERDLTWAHVPASAADELLERINTATLHAGPKENVESRGQLLTDLTKELRQTVDVQPITDKRDRWGRLVVTRQTWSGRGWGSSDTSSETEHSLTLAARTIPTQGFQTKRVGSNRVGHYDDGGSASAAMDLGEAVDTAIERGLPLLLSTEAAGMLGDKVRVGRMKGRPGMVTVTSSDGVTATTRRLPAEQAIGHLRELKQTGTAVALDSGARQLIRMTLAKPLDDDPILLGRQKEVAALMAVGSGLNAAQVGTGKSVMTARGALYHRAATTPRFRGVLVAEGRLLSQWHDELHLGAPARNMPPLAPNVKLLIINEATPVAAQIRAFDRELGDKAGVALVPNSILERYTSDLQVINWHLLVADEALRYVNPATEAHRALRQLRFGSVADCWLLTATPKGKNAENLDVLVGLSVGDAAMIEDRLNSRDAGDLMDEINAHRLRVNYGPHLVRVTRNDMAEWMPKVRPAEPLAIEADDALQELLDAIRSGGREAYRELLGLLQHVKTLDKGNELYQQAMNQIARVQGVVLGNVGVYVDASVDPETLKHSNAALAQALVRKGLVDQACRGGGDRLPLLRSIVAQTIAGVAGEEQVLVFGERVKCLHQLASTVRDRYGVEAHVADGSVSEEDFDVLKRRFCGGEFPVLCLSKVGQAGHNLQNASVLVHLDLPWVQDGLEQRVGRSARPGNTRGYVQTYIPYIKRAGIEHIVSILAERGAVHHMVMDSFEGVKPSESTIALQLGSITEAVADSKDQAGYAGTAARLRVAASVFGQHG